MALLHGRCRQVELALDRSPFSVIATLGYKIDAGVHLAAVIRPIYPAIYLAVLAGQSWVDLKVVDHQLFKRKALLRFRGKGAEFVDCVGKCSHVAIIAYKGTRWGEVEEGGCVAYSFANLPSTATTKLEDHCTDTRCGIAETYRQRSDASTGR